MTRFFTADTHFGDTRILRAAKRPFRTIAEHDAALIAAWQAVVTPPRTRSGTSATSRRARSAKAVGALLAQLPGTKHLVTGNNDDAATRTHPGWASVHDYHELVENEVFCILCHYALRTWNRIGKGSIDLHGHSHAMLKPLTRQFDVGVDAWGYAPRTLAFMREARRKRRTTAVAPPTKADI